MGSSQQDSNFRSSFHFSQNKAGLLTFRKEYPALLMHERSLFSCLSFMIIFWVQIFNSIKYRGFPSGSLKYAIRVASSSMIGWKSTPRDFNSLIAESNSCTSNPICTLPDFPGLRILSFTRVHQPNRQSRSFNLHQMPFYLELYF